MSVSRSNTPPWIVVIHDEETGARLYFGSDDRLTQDLGRAAPMSEQDARLLAAGCARRTDGFQFCPVQWSAA